MPPKTRPSSPDRYQASREGFFGTAITTPDEEQLGLGSPGGPSFTVSSPLVGQLVRNSQTHTTTTTTTSAFHRDDEHDDDDEAADHAPAAESEEDRAEVTSPTATSWISSWFKPSPAKKAAEDETHNDRSISQDTTTTTTSNAVLTKKEKRAAKKQRQAAAKKARVEAAEVAVSATKTTPIEARKEPSPKTAAKKTSPVSPATKRSGAAFWGEGRKEDVAVAVVAAPAEIKTRAGPRSDVRPGMYHHHAVLQPLSWRDFVCDGNPDVIEAPSRTTFTITGNTAEEGDQVVLNPNSVEAILQKVEARVAAKELAIKQERIETQRRMRAKEDRIVARRAQSERSSGWGFSWVANLFKSGDEERAASIAASVNEEDDETPAEDDNDAETSDDDGEVDPNFVPRYLADKGRSVSGVPAKHRGSSTAPPSVARSLADSFGRDSSDEDGSSDGGIDHDAERTLAEGDDFGELSRLRWKRRLERLSNKNDGSTDRKEPRKKRSTGRHTRQNIPLMLSPDGASPQPLLPSSTRLSDANLSPISAVSSKGPSTTTTTTTAVPDVHYEDLAVEFKAHASVYSTGFNAIIPRLGSTKDNTPRVSADDSVLYDFAHRLQSGNLGAIGPSKVGEATVWEQVGLSGRPAGVIRVPATTEQIANFQMGNFLSNKLRSVLVRARTQQEPKHLAEEEAKRIRSERALAARKSQKGRGSTQRSSTVLDNDDNEQPLHSYGLTTAKSNAYVARHFVVEDLITLLDFQNTYFGRSSESLFRASHRPSEVRNMLIQPTEEEENDASLLPFLTIPVSSMQKSELLEHAVFVLERQS